MGFGAGDIKDKFRTYDGDADKRLRKKLEKSGKFDESFKTPVRIEKINVEVMGRWVSERLAELLGFEDDVLSGLGDEHARADERCQDRPGQARRPPTAPGAAHGFLNKQAQPFVAELWKLLLDAQDAPHGIPRAFVERKKAELVKRRAEGGERDRGGRRRQARRPARAEPESESERERGREADAAARRARGARPEPEPEPRAAEEARRLLGGPGARGPAAGQARAAAALALEGVAETPGDYYCVNEKTGERRWQAPSESKPKRSDDKITVVHVLIKHADSRRPASHRTPKISLAKSDARHEADALRKRVAASSDMEAALSDEASKRSDCPSSTNGGRLKPFQRGDLERAFEAAAFRLAVGELSPVVETAAGFPSCCVSRGWGFGRGVRIVVPRDTDPWKPSVGVCPAACARSSVRGARKKACCSRQQRLPNSSLHHEACTIHELRDRPAPGADDGAATAPRGACWRGCRRGQPHRAAGAGQKPLCLPGTNPASALGGPGYTIGILEHDTPSFAAWHKVLEGFGDDLLSAYPPECKVIDEFFIKSRSTETGQDAVLAGLVFETSGLKAVKKFFDNGKSPIFEQGREDGWLTDNRGENVLASAAADLEGELLRRAPTSGDRRPARRRSSRRAGASARARRPSGAVDAADATPAQASAATASAFRMKTGSRPSARPTSTRSTSR